MARIANLKVWPWMDHCDIDLWATDMGLTQNTATYQGKHLCSVLSKSFYASNGLDKNVKVWPWICHLPLPLSYGPGHCIRQIISSKWTCFNESFLQENMVRTSTSPSLTLNLPQWPLPLSSKPRSCARRIASSRWIFVPSNFNFFPCMKRHWSGQTNSKVWPWICRCDLDLRGTDLGLAPNTASHQGEHLCYVISKTFYARRNNDRYEKIPKLDL